MKRNILLLPLSLAFLLTGGASFADQGPLENRNHYLPYLQIGGTRFFNVRNSNSAAGIDFFVPIWQQPNNLIFTDVRIYDRSGKPIEGNFHVGYRHLLPEKQQLYGIYGAFDRKRTSLGNYFNQLTLGGECWWGNLFLGANFYQPIGETTKLTGYSESANLREISSNLYNVWITSNQKNEKAMGGIDIETGYEFIKGLTGYIGGYYFSTGDIDSICGPKAKLAYDWFLGNGKRIGGIFDKLGVEAGVQNDKPRGTIWYLNANFRIGLLPNKNTNLQDVSRHMVDLVRRDVDIISIESQEGKQEVYKENGQEVTYSLPAKEQTGGEVLLLANADPDNKKHHLNNPNSKIITENHLDIISTTGHKLRINIPAIEQNSSLAVTPLTLSNNNLSQQNNQDAETATVIEPIKVIQQEQVLEAKPQIQNILATPAPTIEVAQQEQILEVKPTLQSVSTIPAPTIEVAQQEQTPALESQLPSITGTFTQQNITSHHLLAASPEPSNKEVDRTHEAPATNIITTANNNEQILVPAVTAKPAASENITPNITPSTSSSPTSTESNYGTYLYYAVPIIIGTLIVGYLTYPYIVTAAVTTPTFTELSEIVISSSDNIIPTSADFIADMV